MSSCLIIDGYNLLNKWPGIFNPAKNDIELARQRLFDIMQAYCDSEDVRCIIVFDGNQPNRSTEEGNPSVIYSKESETADTVIESLVYNMEDKPNIRVVTDDMAQANMIIGMGASVLSVTQFRKEAESSTSSLRIFLKDGEGARRLNDKGFGRGICC